MASRNDMHWKFERLIPHFLFVQKLRGSYHTSCLSRLGHTFFGPTLLLTGCTPYKSLILLNHVFTLITPESIWTWIIQPRRWRQHVPSKCQRQPAALHSVTSKYTVATLWTSALTLFCWWLFATVEGQIRNAGNTTNVSSNLNVWLTVHHF